MNLITRQELSPALRQELDDVYNYIAGSNNAEMGAHMLSTSNPHSVTKAQVGLGNVLDVKQATETDFLLHKNDTNNPHGVTTAQIGAVPTSRTVSAGTGLSGGGALSGNVSLSLNTAYTDGRYLLKSEKAADADKLDGYDHTAFHKVGSRFIDMGAGRMLFYGGENDFFFRQEGLLDKRVYHSGNIRSGSAAPSGGNNGDIYIQY